MRACDYMRVHAFICVRTCMLACVSVSDWFDVWSEYFLKTTLTL
uniref:Uncharacterized protein n=1 Tax=Anguilla anguilla TaxID=7936 RepID=A0A0E9QB20_ANGAN